MSKRLVRVLRSDDGLAVVEYALAAVAAAAFAGILFKVVTGGKVSDMLFSVLQQALKVITG